MSSDRVSVADAEAAFRFGDTDFTFKLDWRGIAFFEREARAAGMGCSFTGFAMDLIEDKILRAADPLARPKTLDFHQALFLQAGMQAHHAGIDFETCGRMSKDEDVLARLDLATAAALPAADDGEAVGNGESVTGSTGTRRSETRSKPGSRSPNSGKRRRGKPTPP